MPDLRVSLAGVELKNPIVRDRAAVDDHSCFTLGVSRGYGSCFNIPAAYRDIQRTISTYFHDAIRMDPCRYLSA